MHLRLTAVFVMALAVLPACAADQRPPEAAPTPSAASTRAAEVNAAPGSVDSKAPTAPVAAALDGKFVVTLDPGHGGDESGAAAYGIVEKDSNVDFALRVERFLKQEGVEVVVTRRDTNYPPGITGTGRDGSRASLAERVRLANEVNSDVFVSIHSNGSADASARGIEVYWESRREFADENKRLARTVLDRMIDSSARAGYGIRDRGIIDSSCWRGANGRCVGLYVLSPAGQVTMSGNPQAKVPTQMPGVLVELLFISNTDDVALLKDDRARDSIAQGLAWGIMEFLKSR
ncbi:MAG: N-acetylmuramoyl-L-alanine amidase [Dehalococcoidia bacterium]|nr:MAG: N-acetylmuramoyl-L-alanine amidase [Dehalococcoidia bacterium]